MPTRPKRCGLRWRTKAFRDIVTNITIFRIPILIQSAVSFPETAYAEGWAEIIALEAYRWLGLDDENLIEALQINAMFGYYLQSLCDMGVNGLGWSEADLTSYLSNFGYEDAAAQIYPQLVANRACCCHTAWAK